MSFVGFRRSNRDLEHRRNLFGRVAFSNQLQNFPLARGELLR